MYVYTKCILNLNVTDLVHISISSLLQPGELQRVKYPTLAILIGFP